MFDWNEREEQVDVNLLKDHLEGLVEAFYKTGDTSSIENSLEEMCAELNIEFKCSINPLIMNTHLYEQREQINRMMQ